MAHHNNFNFLRLFFSSAVIISHSFPLTENKEWFANITHDQIDLGALSVQSFFIISGYLIFSSLKYSKTVQNYLWKRVLRLYPALFTMLTVTLLAIPVFAGSSVFFEHSFYSYIPRNLTLYNAQFTVKGVFEENPYPKTINGSLWSLSYEFTMYIIILFLFPLRKNKMLSSIALVTLYCSFLFGYFFGPPQFINSILQYINLDPLLFCKLGIFFTAGSILSLFPLHKINKSYVKIILILFLIAATMKSAYIITSFFTLPLLIILLGVSFSQYLEYIPSKIGDISYGVYIYGFVIQQILMNLFDFNPWELMFLSLPLVYILAFLSWKYVEEPTLKFKNSIK